MTGQFGFRSFIRKHHDGVRRVEINVLSENRYASGRMGQVGGQREKASSCSDWEFSSDLLQEIITNRSGDHTLSQDYPFYLEFQGIPCNHKLPLNFRVNNKIYVYPRIRYIWKNFSNKKKKKTCSSCF